VCVCVCVSVSVSVSVCVRVRAQSNALALAFALVKLSPGNKKNLASKSARKLSDDKVSLAPSLAGWLGGWLGGSGAPRRVTWPLISPPRVPLFAWLSWRWVSAVVGCAAAGGAVGAGDVCGHPGRAAGETAELARTQPVAHTDGQTDKQTDKQTNRPTACERETGGPRAIERLRRCVGRDVQHGSPLGRDL
jgi:hypothetical protein